MSPLEVDIPTGQDDALRDQVQGLIDEAGTKCDADERRKGDRFQIPFLFRLTPIHHDGSVLIDETTTVVGKDLSLSGISFSHDIPLAHRRALVVLYHSKLARFAVEAEIIWTRMTPLGLYESGCRIIRRVKENTP